MLLETPVRTSRPQHEQSQLHHRMPWRCALLAVRKALRGELCPSVCGETCPGAEDCQICAEPAVKRRTVDYIPSSTFEEEVDLDQVPCVVASCGHVLDAGKHGWPYEYVGLLCLRCAWVDHWVEKERLQAFLRIGFEELSLVSWSFAKHQIATVE